MREKNGEKFCKSWGCPIHARGKSGFPSNLSAGKAELRFVLVEKTPTQFHPPQLEGESLSICINPSVIPICTGVRYKSHSPPCREMPFREDQLWFVFMALSFPVGIFLGATATLPPFPPEQRVCQGQRDVRACKTCQGCVKCVLVGAVSAGLGACVAVGIPACVRYTDVISYHTDVADLQSNIPAPPSMAVFPNYCTYMFLLCFRFICMIISFPIKQPRFSSKQSSSIHVCFLLGKCL